MDYENRSASMSVSMTFAQMSRLERMLRAIGKDRSEFVRENIMPLVEAWENSQVPEPTIPSPSHS